jgi:hypothetical protein
MKMKNLSAEGIQLYLLIKSDGSQFGLQRCQLQPSQ